MAKKNKSNNRKKQNKGRKKQVVRIIKENKPKHSLTECGMKYLMALKDPFSPLSMNACVPRAPARPSQKVSYKARFTAAVGESGIGYVLISPTTANDTPIAYATNGTFTGDQITVAGTYTSPIVPAGLPYSQVSFNISAANLSTTPNVQSRIISVGVRWRYIGTTLSQGGATYSYIDPNHNNQNGSTFTEVASKAETASRPVSRKWQNIVIAAVDYNELDYGNIHESRYLNENVALLQGIYPFSDSCPISSTQPGYWGGAPAVVMFTGTQNNSFEFEIISHIEYVGKSTQALLSPSHGDDEALNLGLETSGSTLKEMASSTIDWAGSFARSLSRTYIEHRSTLGDVASIAALLGGGAALRGRLRVGR